MEYRTVSDEDQGRFDEQLGKLASDGWLVDSFRVAVVPHVDSVHADYVLFVALMSRATPKTGGTPGGAK